MDLEVSKLKIECQKCRLLKNNGGDCGGKKAGPPCLGFKTIGKG